MSEQSTAEAGTPTDGDANASPGGDYVHKDQVNEIVQNRLKQFERSKTRAVTDAESRARDAIAQKLGLMSADEIDSFAEKLSQTADVETRAKQHETRATRAEKQLEQTRNELTQIKNMLREKDTREQINTLSTSLDCNSPDLLYAHLKVNNRLGYAEDGSICVQTDGQVDHGKTLQDLIKETLEALPQLQGGSSSGTGAGSRPARGEAGASNGAIDPSKAADRVKLWSELFPDGVNSL